VSYSLSFPLTTATIPVSTQVIEQTADGEISHISGSKAAHSPFALDRPRPLPPPKARRTSQQLPFRKMLTRLSLLSSSFRSNSSRQRAICRICHGDASNSSQPLISPCRCSGSCGAVHKECLETWLSTAKNSKCEICGFEFDVTKEYKPWTKWMCYRPFDRDQRNLTGDLVCFVIFTPLVLVSTYLCGSAVSYYLSLANGRLEAAGLVLLMSFLSFVYSIWLFLTLRFHWDAYREWKKQTLEIKLNTYSPPKPEDRRHNAHDNSVFQSPCYV